MAPNAAHGADAEHAAITREAKKMVEDGLRALASSEGIARPTLDQFVRGLYQQVNNAGIKAPERDVLHGEIRFHWWELARLGVVAIGAEFDPILVTERGRRWLQTGELAPHDWERYRAAVGQRVGHLDPIVMTYLEEAAGAWRSDLNRSSVVMLGSACERLIVLLAEAVSDSTIVPFSEKLAKMLKGPKPVGVSELFEQVRGALNAQVEDRRLAGELADAIDRKLTPIFEHARALRNAHGHPTGAEVSAEDAEAGLLLFPGFYALVDRLLAHLRGRAAPPGKA
jgi:hypothetical protein